MSTHRLPPEILSHVFILSLPVSLTPSYKRAVILSANVCGLWRDIALSTPQLWSSITLTLLPNSLQHDLDLTRAWLSRSAAVPLTLHIDGTRWPSSAVHPVIDLLVEHAERWQHVDFRVSNSIWSNTSPVKNRLLSLRTLAIRDPLSPWSHWSPLLDPFEVAPQLTTLSMGYYVPPTLLKVPWSQLTSIQMSIGRSMSLHQFHEVLQGAPNLVEFDLCIYTSVIDPHRQLTHHDHLRTLKVSASANAGPFLDSLSLPALRSFHYQAFAGGWPQAQFISLLSRSSCSLHELVLSFRDPARDDHLIHCLRLMPSLVHLQLDIHASAAMSHKSLALLTYPRTLQHKHPLAPKLDFLSLHLDNLFGDDAALAGMIESRQSVASPLKTLQLHAEGPLTASTLARLHHCAQAGLNLDLRLRGDL